MITHKVLSHSLFHLKHNKNSQNITHKYAITILAFLLKKYDKKFTMKSLSDLLDRSLPVLYDYLKLVGNLAPELCDTT